MPSPAAGGENHDWSSHFCDPGMVAMGNGLISERTASAMANTFRATKGDDLEARLMSAARGQGATRAAGVAASTPLRSWSTGSMSIRWSTCA